MDKRLDKLLKSGAEFTDGCMIDTYNQQVQQDTACAIRTNINTANHHYIVERDTEMKGNYDEPRICSMVGRDPNNPKSRKKSEEYVQMVELGDDVSNTLTTVQKDNLVAEPNVLTPKRTEYGKKMRKAYESGDVKMSRHDFQEMRPRTDGVSNTITSVEKDNYLAETSFRIRKLTERECFRLMGVGDNEIDKIQASGVSRSQQYKMAGNSIVVDVLFHLFRKLFAEKGCESEQLSLF
jgi:site-specific DNA-cytosine methylase